MPTSLTPLQKVQRISDLHISIYDSIDNEVDDYWLTADELSTLLNGSLVGKSLAGLPNKTRSKRLKNFVCDALCYPQPTKYSKTQPRFKGLNFDVYGQKSNNLQIWNETVDATRRYVLVQINEIGIVTKVKVVTGSDLALLDTTGTLTKKHQARLNGSPGDGELVNKLDTDPIRKLLCGGIESLKSYLPTAAPSAESLLPIESIFSRIKDMIGTKIPNPGHDQERIRGGELHKQVCNVLGYDSYLDDGRFPDIKHQLLEIKLQSSPTIDLGLIKPDSTSPLDIEQINNVHIRHCDVRYAIFYAEDLGNELVLRNVYLTSGAHFFSKFQECKGNGINSKSQIRLPKDFFSH